MWQNTHPSTRGHRTSRPSRSGFGLLVGLLLAQFCGACYVSVPISRSNRFKAFAAAEPADAPLQVGKTTKSQAAHLLGFPEGHSDDDAVWSYRELVTDAVGLWLPLIIPVHGGPIQPE